MFFTFFHRSSYYAVCSFSSSALQSKLYASFILVLQVAPPGTVYVPYYGAAPPYQAYQGPYGGESSYGHPPPYAPPTAPPPTQK